VCAFSHSEFFAPVVRESGHQVHQLDVVGKHPWFAAVKKLRPIIANFKPDIIKTWLYDASIAGRLVQMFNPKIPLITTLHSSSYEPETIRAAQWSPYKVEVLRRIDLLTARFAKSRYVACSNFVKKSNQKNLNIPDSQIRVIYNGIDPAFLQCKEGEPQRVRKDFAIPNDGFVYVTVGRIDSMKNQVLLLRAFPQVLSVVPEAYLMIVGTGVLEQELKDLTNSLGIADRVRFLGRRPDVGACLEASDVFVFPTLLEGHPLALVEAMFKKLPAVASNIEVLREVLSDNENGLLFNPNAQNELSAAMCKLFHQPEVRQRIAERALKDAGDRFHISKIVSQWEFFYNQVIDETKRH
jgi:glycosyltransferase involved in cell wall biosynthesis